MDVHTLGEGSGRYHTKATSLATWLFEDLEHELVAHFRVSITELEAWNPRDIVVQPIRSATVLRRTVIHRGRCAPGRMLLSSFVPPGLCTRMLTVEPEALTD